MGMNDYSRKLTASLGKFTAHEGKKFAFVVVGNCLTQETMECASKVGVKLLENHSTFCDCSDQ